MDAFAAAEPPKLKFEDDCGKDRNAAAVGGNPAVCHGRLTFHDQCPAQGAPDKAIRASHGSGATSQKNGSG